MLKTEFVEGETSKIRCGGGGIRTPEELTLAGFFQDQCNRRL